MSSDSHDYLRRLDASAYQGIAYVHWTFTIHDRKQGWLDSNFHHQFREILIHMCFRYHIWCPAYCLMPDHMHLMLVGASKESDQKLSTKWLRRRLNALLKEQNFELQRQGYDHVLRPDERDRFAFEKTVHYIFENPARANLTDGPWEFSGAVLPGYPEISPTQTNYWDKFWKLYYAATED